VKRTFEALTTIVSVTVDDDLPIGELAELVLDGYTESSRAPELTFELHRGALISHGDVKPFDDPFDLVAVLELDLYHLVAERAAPGWLLHAAALERDGRAIVLAGPSGAGKTTLSLALVARGWRIATEEMVLIDASLAVRGLARPLHAPAGGPQHRAMPASWRRLDYPLRGSSVRGVVAQPIAAHRIAGPLPLGALIRIDHAPEAVARLTPLAPVQAIARLWPCSLRQDDPGLAAATAIAGTIEPLELVSASVDAAVDLVTGLDH
jgi:hypothetical protein